MRIIALVLALFLLAAACGGGEVEEAQSPTAPVTATASPTPSATASPPPSPAPTAAPTATPPPFATDLERFLEFAPEVAQAVAAGDAAFFADRAVEHTIVCEGGQEFGACAHRNAGEVVTGISSGALGSDASGLLPRDEFEARLTEWFTAALPDEVDEYGSGAPTLYGVGWDNDQSQARAVVTLIIDGALTSGPEKGRVFRVFGFERTESGWLLTFELVANSVEIAPEWLSGDCAQCYDVWVRWEEKQ